MWLLIERRDKIKYLLVTVIFLKKDSGVIGYRSTALYQGVITFSEGTGELFPMNISWKQFRYSKKVFMVSVWFVPRPLTEFTIIYLETDPDVICERKFNPDTY